MKYPIAAYHLGKSFEIKEIKKVLDFSLLKRESSFLMYQVKEDSFLYIKNYGSVVFFNCSEEWIQATLKIVSKGHNISIDNAYQESYEMLVDDKIEVEFDKIFVPMMNSDNVHIVMLNVAQSVALQDYVNKTSELHDSTLLFTKQLEETGKIRMSKTKMRMFIGKTLNLKNSITEELFVFDTPELAWHNEELSKLDQLLKEELDIEKRFQSLHFSLNTIKENLDLFQNILQHRYSSMLEWIIILLILFEVVQIFF